MSRTTRRAKTSGRQLRRMLTAHEADYADEQDAIHQERLRGEPSDAELDWQMSFADLRDEEETHRRINEWAHRNGHCGASCDICHEEDARRELEEQPGIEEFLDLADAVRQAADLD